MGRVTAKQLIRAAASVRGAQAAGLETEASKQAPALLDQAFQVLARLESRASEDALCDRGGRAVAQYKNFAAAVKELTAALGEADKSATSPTASAAPSKSLSKEACNG